MTNRARSSFGEVWPVASIYPAIQGDRVFFDSENQLLSDIHLPPRLDADAQVGDRFADNVAR